MSLVKAQCTNCNGILEVNPANDAAVCPHCGTPYVVEKAINNYNTNIYAPNATINIKDDVLDADTFFDKWYSAVHNGCSYEVEKKIGQEFEYNYPTDPRCRFIRYWRNQMRHCSPNESHIYVEFLNDTLSGEKNNKYYQQEMNWLNKKVNEWIARNEEIEQKKRETKRRDRNAIIRLIAFILFSIIFVSVLFIHVSMVLGIIVGLILAAFILVLTLYIRGDI